MPRRLIDEKEVSLAEAKNILEGEKEALGEFQRRTLDYLTKFTKINEPKALKLIKELTNKFGLERAEAIQIANCMPSSINELRSILSIKGKVLLTSQLDEILKGIKKIK